MLRLPVQPANPFLYLPYSWLVMCMDSSEYYETQALGASMMQQFKDGGFPMLSSSMCGWTQAHHAALLEQQSDEMGSPRIFILDLLLRLVCWRGHEVTSVLIQFSNIIELGKEWPQTLERYWVDVSTSIYTTWQASLKWVSWEITPVSVSALDSVTAKNNQGNKMFKPISKLAN